MRALRPNSAVNEEVSWETVVRDSESALVWIRNELLKQCEFLVTASIQPEFFSLNSSKNNLQSFWGVITAEFQYSL